MQCILIVKAIILLKWCFGELAFDVANFEHFKKYNYWQFFWRWQLGLKIYWWILRYFPWSINEFHSFFLWQIDEIYNFFFCVQIKCFVVLLHEQLTNFAIFSSRQTDKIIIFPETNQWVSQLTFFFSFQPIANFCCFFLCQIDKIHNCSPVSSWIRNF